ncbi:hypothetical protein GCM10010404_92810 [Nonomuraea africana]
MGVLIPKLTPSPEVDSDDREPGGWIAVAWWRQDRHVLLRVGEVGGLRLDALRLGVGHAAFVCIGVLLPKLSPAPK